MFKKNITYTDFNGQERKEVLYFHMSLVERTKLDAKLNGTPLDEYAKILSINKNTEEMVQFIENIILDSYGEKSADGKTFTKNKEIRDRFENSQAYADLFEELILNPDVAEAFAKGVVTQTKNINKASVTQSNEIETLE